MNRKKIILGIGELLWDCFPSGRQIGGAPGNFVYHIRQLGGDGALISAVGDDQEGVELLDQLRTRGIGTDYITVHPRYQTGAVTIELDKQGVPSYDILKNRAWDHIPWQESYRSLLTEAAAICFGTLAQRTLESRCTIQRLLYKAPEACLRIFDINLRQSFYSQDLIEESLTYADLLKLNEEELQVLIRFFHLPTERKRAVRSLLSLFNLKVVILTNGGIDSMLYDGDTLSILPTPASPIVDTVGAGDAFTAAVTMGVLNKEPLSAIHQRAIQVASFVCSQPGAMPRYDDTTR